MSNGNTAKYGCISDFSKKVAIYAPHTYEISNRAI